jgi:hypothetical protein
LQRLAGGLALSERMDSISSSREVAARYTSSPTWYALPAESIASKACPRWHCPRGIQDRRTQVGEGRVSSPGHPAAGAKDRLGLESESRHPAKDIFIQRRGAARPLQRD